MIPTVDFLGTQISRLIIGDNPVNGHSYIPEITGGGEMVDYYTEQHVLDLIRRSGELGINAMLPLANDFMIRAIRHYRMEGGRINLIFQSYVPMDFAVNLRQMLEAQPLGIYIQGTTVDGLVEAGQADVVRERIKMVRDAGVLAGLGTHVPETVLRAEEEDWGADFYVTCLHNTRKRGFGEASSFITGKKKGIRFFMEDRAEMFQVITRISKPCIAFKILAGGQIFYDHQPEEYPAILERAIRETYAHVKPTDIAAIGVFQRDRDQIAENVRILEHVLCG